MFVIEDGFADGPKVFQHIQPTSGTAMKIPWPGLVCIICLREAPLSEEHVIPKSIGGDLTCNLICKPCNDSLGSNFEARAKTDPAIRLAVGHLRSEIPAIYGAVEEGQLYFSQSGPVRTSGIFRGGAVDPRAFRHHDGSLMVPSEEAPKHIERMLIRRGHDTHFVRSALAKFAESPEGQRIELSREISAINWQTDPAKQDLSTGVPLDPRVAVKIAFEFLALILGAGVYDESPQLNELRRVLQSDVKSDAFHVERLLAKDYAPFHGICFEGNDPYAKIQVRLFGKLAYRIHLLRLALGGPKIVYTHLLKTGEHDVRAVDPDYLGS